MASAQEQADEASAAMDAIVKEVASLEQDHTKQKVPPPFQTTSDQ
jgi:hypothetical protein